jgi:hypothetical protein
MAQQDATDDGYKDLDIQGALGGLGGYG